MNILITGCARSGTTLLLRLMKGFLSLNVVDDIEVHPNQINKYSKAEKSTVIKCPQGASNPNIDFRPFPNIDFGPFWLKFVKTSFLHYYVESLKVIICVRDGRDVLTSYHYLKPNEYWVKPKRWIKAVHRMLPLRNHANVLIVKYENLVKQPHEEMNRIGKFLKLSFAHDWIENFYKEIPPDLWMTLPLNSVRPIDQKSVGRWMNPGHQHRIEIIYEKWGSEIDQLLSELGYRQNRKM